MQDVASNGFVSVMFMGHRDVSSFVLSGSAAMSQVPSSCEEMMVVEGASATWKTLYFLVCFFSLVDRKGLGQSQ